MGSRRSEVTNNPTNFAIEDFETELDFFFKEVDEAVDEEV